MNKGIVAVIVLAVGAVGAWYVLQPDSGGNGIGSNPSSDQTFDIGMVTFAGYAPLYLAEEKGFFADLDVKFHRIEEIPSIRAGVTGGKLEGYLGTLDIALDTNEKPPGVAVWAIDESSGGDGVVVAEGIENLADLKGMKVAAEPGLPPNFVMMYLLHENGLSLSDVEFQDMTTQNASTAFVSKSVDAAGLYEPFLSTSKDQRKGSKIVISSADTPGLIVDLIFVDESVIATRKDDITKLIVGWNKAVQFISDSPDEAYDIMAKSFDLPVDEFKDIAGGVKWLSLSDNRTLFGTEAADGPIYRQFDVVGNVLRRNRDSVYKAEAKSHLTREFITQAQ